MKLANAIFGPKEEERSYHKNVDGEVIFYPTTDDELNEMLELFEQMESTGDGS